MTLLSTLLRITYSCHIVATLDSIHQGSHHPSGDIVSHSLSKTLLRITLLFTLLHISSTHLSGDGATRSPTAQGQIWDLGVFYQVSYHHISSATVLFIVSYTPCPTGAADRRVYTCTTPVCMSFNVFIYI